MDNIGDWLYVVFIIIAAISSILSSGKKKKHSKEILGQPGRTFSPPQPANRPAPANEVINKPHPRNPEKKKARKTPPPPPPMFLQGDRIPQTSLQERETGTIYNEAEPEHPSGFSLRNPDDLKKAVIYTEILNRKY